MTALRKAEIIAQLQQDVLRLQGLKSVGNEVLNDGLGAIKNSFPNASFPLGCLHEFLSDKAEVTATTIGFIAGLMTSLMGSNGTTLWISSTRSLFPGALKNFGLQPDHFIFIDLQREKDVIWVMDEALKCGALTAVVGELSEISFTNSRRLQLAAEQSQVTGFILRNQLKRLDTSACVSRWKIKSLPSEPIRTDVHPVGLMNELPGIGFPKWKVELIRIRNGKPATWEVCWMNKGFHISDPASEQRLRSDFSLSVFDKQAG